MKKLFLMIAVLFAGLTVFTACGDDNKNGGFDGDAKTLDYNSSNAQAWGNYMRVVANLLKEDATTLYNEWNTSYNESGKGYADVFKEHNGTAGFNSALNCVEQIIDGCTDIAGEVGSAKIGDPYHEYLKGNKEDALFMVESWYSWHSIEDYSNNIRSIRNAYFGSRDGRVAEASISAVVASVNEELDNQAKELIQGAIDAIENIPAPFRNNIDADEVAAAMDACADLEDFLDNTLKPFIHENSEINTDEVLDPVVKNYVDVVVLPTYKELQEANTQLNNAVIAFQTNPSDAAFQRCADAWFTARTPWESSEAFLFGPVADKGLDPNMDSWPLDQAGIVQIMKSKDWAALVWTGEYDEESETIEQVQALRGFHTLEYLIFKDGKARKVNN
ncbi:MAG: peptidase M75 [Bacteroidaceae bacterium]|nr:peptidase M75 [Bacteroidaceae bacterium]